MLSNPYFTHKKAFTEYHNHRTPQNHDLSPTKTVDKLPTSDAILIVMFGICLPTWDVYSDLAFIVDLFTRGLSHPKFASMMFGPLTASILFTISHWWRSEGTWFRRLVTLPLLLGLCWPQYRAVRILVLGLCMKVSSWRKEKETIDKDVSSIGKIYTIITFLLGTRVLSSHFVEPFVEAVPQVMLLINFLMLEKHLVEERNLDLFMVTFVTSILSASLGLTKFLKLGPCRLLGGYGKISFLLVMLNIIGVLLTKGFSVIIIKEFIRRAFRNNSDKSLKSNCITIWICTCFMPGFIYVRTIFISKNIWILTKSISLSG